MGYGHGSHETHDLQITKAVPLKRKEVDDVLGGEDAWKNVQKTDGEQGTGQQGMWLRALGWE